MCANKSTWLSTGGNSPQLHPFPSETLPSGEGNQESQEKKTSASQNASPKNESLLEWKHRDEVILFWEHVFFEFARPFLWLPDAKESGGSSSADLENSRGLASGVAHSSLESSIQANPSTEANTEEASPSPSLTRAIALLKQTRGMQYDSRLLEEGDLFLVRSGEKTHGKFYIPQALEKKISGIVMEKQDLDEEIKNLPVPVLVVPNLLWFYQRVASFYLQFFRKTVIAITGTSGKTSTKDWLASFLRTQFSVFASFQNYNNVWGVPYSLLSTRGEEIAIFELGTGKPGDIAFLASLVQPDYAIVTNIGHGHMEFFSSFAEMVEEKCSLMQWAKKSYALASTPLASFVRKEAVTLVSPETLFTVREELPFEGYTLQPQELNREAKPSQENTSADKAFFPLFGKFTLENVALAWSLARDLGISLSHILATLPTLSFSGLRQKKMIHDKVTWILDCYNASPESMMGLLATYAVYPDLLFILGDMKELGQSAAALHAEVGRYLQEHLHLSSQVYFLGQDMYEAFLHCPRGKYFHSREELKIELQKSLDLFKFIVVKGARSMEMEEIYFSLYPESSSSLTP